MLYYFIFFSLFLLGYLDILRIESSFRKFIFWIFILFFIVMGGIRWETGTDWYAYLNFFERNDSWKEFKESDFEIGFSFINYIIKFLFNSYTALLIPFSFFTISLKANIIVQKDYFKYGIVSLLIYYSYYLGDMFFVRQSLSLSITFFSISYIISRDLKRFILCIVVASLIHVSALLFIFAYPISKINITTGFAVVILITSAIIGYFLSSSNAIMWINNIPFLGSIDQISDKVDVYTDLASSDIDVVGSNIDPRMTVITGAIRKVIVFAPLFFFRKRLEQYVPKFNMYLSLLVFGAVFYFIFGSIIPVFKRAAAFYDCFEILIIPFFLTIFRSAWKRNLTYIVIGAYAFSKFYLVINAYWEVFVPYYSIFSENIIRHLK
ncbi:EpsG family protein [Niabella sp. CJ426]|uniref:EpsG family protein n=1 Tax=Niabella sp. CJ426 TaxID=3393740 RepID=UPI003CFEC7DA